MLPPRVRVALYLLTAVGSALVAYAVACDWIGDAEVALWVALASIPNVIAASNVTDTPPAEDDARGRHEA